MRYNAAAVAVLAILDDSETDEDDSVDEMLEMMVHISASLSRKQKAKVSRVR